MKITELKINSFRGIDDLTLKFNPDEPTVIMGVNGVGKSSILDCLTYLFESLASAIIFEFQVSKLVPVEITNILNELEEGLKFDFVNNFEDIKIGNKISFIEVKAINIIEDNNLSWRLEIHSPESSGRTNFVDLEKFAKQIYKNLRLDSKTNLFIFIYYSIYRGFLKNLIQLDAYKNTNFHQLYAYKDFLGGIDFTNLLQWLRLSEDLENERIRDNSNYRDKGLQAVRQAIYSLIPEFSNLRVRRSPFRITVNKKTGNILQEFSLNQLSEGEQCLLAMVGDIARRLAIANPSLDDPLQGEGVVLIDEIELHLHPQWQRKIIPALTQTFPNCQFIITTHSPQVVSHVQPENIYILTSTPQGIKAYKPEASFGRDSNQILEDLMDTPSRPQEIQEQLSELFRLIADNKLEEAKRFHDTIAEEIGEDEPELIKAEVAIRRKELIGR